MPEIDFSVILGFAAVPMLDFNNDVKQDETTHDAHDDAHDVGMRLRTSLDLIIIVFRQGIEVIIHCLI